MEGGSDSNSESDCACSTCPQDIIILLDSEFIHFLEPHANNYQELNPHINIRLHKVEGAAKLQELMLGGESANSRWDGAIFPSQNVGILAEADALWDMSKFTRQSETLEWPEVLPFFRHEMARYGETSIKMIPLDGDVLTMFYRRDLFEEFDIQVPRTWNEYVEAARFFHGKALGPRGSLMYGSCVSRADGCANEYWTSLILSSMTQTGGTSSGFFLDPETLDPLFGEAMDASLNILAEQFKFGHPDELLGGCLESNYSFNKGNCALTYNWGSQITVPSSRFDIGVAPTPGSKAVLDRATNTLKPCSEDTCPHGIFYEDIGIVNHAPYSAFGGWAAGVSNVSPESKQYAAASFFAYVSNSQQSLGDVLPNDRSLFAQPYRYEHVTTSNWIGADFEQSLAEDFTSSVRGISNDNSVLELRLPLGAQFRKIVDEEVSDYLDQIGQVGPDGDNSELRKEVTSRLDDRIREAIASADEDSNIPLLESYRRSIGFSGTTTETSNNLIDEDYRHAGWGLAGLMCITTLVVMAWIIRYRSNRVMRAFQPFLLMQSAIGLFLMAATIVPLGLDDSWVSEDVLDITCMLIPWMYVTGFTMFFSSVYCKIRKCVHIYRNPSQSDVLYVSPGSAMRLNLRLFLMNGVVLVVWTIVDPLKWVRKEVEGGMDFENGTIETYGICIASSWGSLTFGLTLFFINFVICCIGTIQAFNCRFLVLEYNEMQWLPLSLFPFIEVWLIGAPIVALIYTDPTLLFVVLSTMIAASTITAGLAVFAPKDWYMRKYRYAKRAKDKKDFQRDSSAGVLVLKHPTVESQKQLEDLRNQFEQIHSYNTELEIEIRTMKDKFLHLTSSQKYAVAQVLFGVSDTLDSREHRAVEEFEQTEISKANDAELEAMEQFERVWKMPDDDYDDEHDVGPVPVPVPIMLPGGQDSASSVDVDGYARADKECAPMESTSRAMAFNSSGKKRQSEWDYRLNDKSTGATLGSVPLNSEEDLSTTRDSTLLSRSGALPTSPESNGLSIYEDQESREAPTAPLDAAKAAPPSPLADDPSRIEWFLNSCDDSEEESGEQDPDAILAIAKRALSNNPMYEQEANVEVPPQQAMFDDESESDVSDEAPDLIFKKKDAKELRSMIKEDDLPALEQRASFMAESLKSRLMDSHLADLSGENESGSANSKDENAPKSFDLDISTIPADADTTRDFVVMSDSILGESPARAGAARGDMSDDPLFMGNSRDYSNHSDSRSSGRPAFAPSAGESTAANVAVRGGNESSSSSSPAGSEGYTTQNAGEPSEGDRRSQRSPHKPNHSYFSGDERSFPDATPGEIGYDPRPSKKLPAPKTLSFREDESFEREGLSRNKSYSISDWSAVGNTASILQDWSDSRSDSSYSHAESTSSLEATTRASALDTPLANEIDKLVAKLDWDGVKHASAKFEKEAQEGARKSRNMSIQEKRRKKRELEAWRTSITRSYSKGPDD